MEAQIVGLAEKVVDAYRSCPPDRRLLIAIAGIPGSGKSTLAYPLTDSINRLILGHPPSHPAHIDAEHDIAAPDRFAGEGDDVAICVGLDGWHLSRAKLDTFDDPVEAHWRRGAAYTFDLPGYLSFLSLLRLPLTPNPPKAIPFPTFDHAVKDPAPSNVPILPRHRIVIVEGLYCHLSLQGWKDCAEMFDMRIWVDCPKETARQRVIKRNFEAGIVADLDRSAERVDAVDMVNADLILANRVAATDVVESIDAAALIPR